MKNQLQSGCVEPFLISKTNDNILFMFEIGSEKENNSQKQEENSDKKNGNSVYSSVAMTLPYDINDEIEEYEEGMKEGLLKFRQFVEKEKVMAKDVWIIRPFLEVYEFVEVIEEMGYRFCQAELDCLEQISSDSLLEKTSFRDLGIWQRRNSQEKLGLNKSVSQNMFFKTEKGAFEANQSKGAQSRVS